MKELIPYEKPTKKEQAFINSISRKYHIKGNDNSSRCILNQLNWSENESKKHLKRKLVLALNSKYFISECSRTNIVMDYGKKFPYRNPNGDEIIRDLVTILPCYTIHEIETCIGHGTAKTYKRFLFSLPWVKYGGEYGANIKEIRDPDYLKISLHLAQDNKWNVYSINSTSNSKKYFSDHKLALKPIKIVCTIPVEQLGYNASKRIETESIHFDSSRLADYATELIEEYKNLK